MRIRGRRRWGERARVLPALFFALVWLLGYEIVPLAHQALHARIGAHSHGAASVHCHGASCHSEDEAKQRPTQDTSSHGAGSLEHRAVAALTPDLTIYVPELMLAGELPPDVVLASRLETFERCSPPARGPPA